MAKKSETSTHTTPSDQAISLEINHLLRQSHHSTSINDVVDHLSTHFNVDLYHRAPFILHHLNLLSLYRPLPPPPSPPPPPELAGDPAEFLQSCTQFMAAHEQWVRHVQGSCPTTQIAPPRGQDPAVEESVTPPADDDTENEGSQSGPKKGEGGEDETKLCGVSPELQAIVGDTPMTKAEILKRVLDYASKNNLYHPNDNQMILCDAALRTVLATDCSAMNLIQDNENLAKHILPLNPTTATTTTKDSDCCKPLETDVEDAAECSEGAASAVTISDALALFLGTTTRDMLPTEATQRVLEYVKLKILEDPRSMAVVCDTKLKELFGRDTVPIVEIKDLIARHHLSQSS